MTARHLAFAALAVALVVTVLVARGATDDSYTLRAQFDDVRGLIAGGEVRAGAVTVGKVKKVEIGPDDRLLVTMGVDGAFRLHEGATADVRLASNVGAVNRTVELVQGDETGPRLPDGALLTVRRTDQPVNFDEAVETLDPETREDIGELLGGLEAAVHDRGADLDRTLDHSAPALVGTSEVLAQLNRDGEALRTVVGDGERVVSSLAAADLSSAADRVAGLLAATGNRERELTASVRELGPALRAGRGMLDSVTEAAPDLRRLAAGTDPVVDELGPLVRLLPDLNEAAAPLLDQTRKLVARAPAQLDDILLIASAARPVAAKLAPVAEEALPLARVLQVYVPETVGAFQNFGATAGAYDATGHVLNVAAAVNPVPAPSTLAAGEIGPEECDPDAPSRVTPGLLKKPFIRLPGVNECQPWSDLPDGILGG